MTETQSRPKGERVPVRVGVFAGSFDPVTRGHLDIVERAARLFDELIVAVLVNADKQARFSIAERVRFIQASTAHLANARVDQFTGLVADYVQKTGAMALVRGVRTEADFAVEWRLATMNRALTGGVETILLPAKAELSHISSSLIKEIAGYGGDIRPFVTAAVVSGFECPS